MKRISEAQIQKEAALRHGKVEVIGAHIAAADQFDEDYFHRELQHWIVPKMKDAGATDAEIAYVIETGRAAAKDLITGEAFNHEK